MKNILVIALFIVISNSCKQIQEDINLDILLNDEAIKEGTLTFSPGLSNIIEVNPDWELITDAELQCTIRKILLGGAVEESRRMILNGDGAEIVLGPMTSPPVYEFKAGDVYQKGYGINIIIKRKWGFRPLIDISLRQGLSDIERPTKAIQFSEMEAGYGKLISGRDQNILYNPMYGIEAPLGLRLHEGVLGDQDGLRILYRLTPGGPCKQLTSRLNVRSRSGEIMLEREVNLKQSGDWQTEFVDPGNWDPGNYTISLYPKINDTIWEEGPMVVYRRRDIDPNELHVSPVAPWTLKRDTSR